MNKSDLIEALAHETGIHRRDAEVVVKEIFEAMTEALIRGDSVQIRGFGTFTVRTYRAYTGRNPRTGEKIEVPPKRLPFFKVGKELRERVKDKVKVDQ